MQYTMHRIVREYLHCKQTVQAMQAELEQLPRGTLTYRTVHGKQYCSLQFRDTAQKIHNKAVHASELEALQQKIQRRSFLKENVKILQSYIRLLEKGYPALKELAVGNNGFSKTENGNKPYLTLKGDYVRSKSEVIIADTLYAHQISYAYEKPLALEGCQYTFYPDFTIYTADKKVIYWEHCGLIDVEDYRSKWKWKKNLYENGGISEWNNNLIVTYETKNDPLRVELVQEYVERLQRR